MTLAEIEQELKEANQAYHDSFVNREWDGVTEAKCKIQELSEAMDIEVGEEAADIYFMFPDNNDLPPGY